MNVTLERICSVIAHRFKILYLAIIYIILIFLLAAHTFSLFNAVVDTYSILIIVLLIFLPVVPKIKKFKYGDSEIELSEEKVKELEKKVDMSLEKAKPLPKTKIKGYSEENIQELEEYLFSLVESDPVLALAKLRMELELVIRDIRNSIIEKDRGRMSGVFYMLMEIGNKSNIDRIVLHNTKEVIIVCNKAIHGEDINQDVARGIVKMGMKLINYFYGYSRDLKTK